LNPTNELRFSLTDRIDDIEIGPSRVPLALLGQFQLDVSDFLKGSSRDVDPMQVQIAIEDGSLTLVASELLAAGSLWSDLDKLKQAQSLDQIDPKRAAVIERWQAAARQSRYRRYVIGESSKKPIVRVDVQSNYRVVAESAWVVVEKYLHGRIIDLGGKNKANVHLEIEGGAVLQIASAQDLLAKEERNWVYRPALLHVTAEQNLQTGELRKLRLLAFERYAPSYDEGEYKRMVERGTRAWADVKDAAAWIDNLRGGKH
jgi:hypothetical protein